MNPARTFGPDQVSGNFTHYLVYVAGPLAGAAVAVGIAFVLRGRGGGAAGSGAGQGALFTASHDPGNP
jgi:aquaporin Z